MSNQMKNGKKPLSSKITNSFVESFASAGILTIPALKAELKAKGLVPRWINSKELYNNQGYHKHGWVPYKRNATIASPNSDSLRLGSDPEGLVRRGDCILAVKSEDQVADQKAYLADKARRLKSANSDRAKELKAMLKSTGVEGKVYEGYEDNDGDDE